MLDLTPEGLEQAQKLHSKLDPALAEYSTETLTSLMVSAWSMIDFYEVGGREPRRTKRYLEMLENRRWVAKELQDPKYSRITVEAIFKASTNMMIDASAALKKRVQNGESAAIPYAQRASRRKSRPVSGT